MFAVVGFPLNVYGGLAGELGNGALGLVVGIVGETGNL
jgi:hypothetical protein